MKNFGDMVIIVIIVFMSFQFFSKLFLTAAACVTFLFGGLSVEAGVVNDCLISAAKAQYQLAPGIWSRLLIVRYDDVGLQHAYLVYLGEKGDLVAFDNIHGVRHFGTPERNSSALARIIDLRAKWGWYVEDNANNPHLAAN
jgi:hypothetical protein